MVSCHSWIQLDGLPLLHKTSNWQTTLPRVKCRCISDCLGVGSCPENKVLHLKCGAHRIYVGRAEDQTSPQSRFSDYLVGQTFDLNIYSLFQWSTPKISAFACESHLVEYVIRSDIVKKKAIEGEGRLYEDVWAYIEVVLKTHEVYSCLESNSICRYCHIMEAYCFPCVIFWDHADDSFISGEAFNSHHAKVQMAQ